MKKEKWTRTTIVGVALGCMLGADASEGRAVAAPQEDQAQERGATEEAARAAAPKRGKVMSQELISTTATVQSIDRENREVTLRNRAGDEMTVSVPEDMTGFDRLKKGDRVNVDYYQSLAVAMAPPGTEPAMRERTTGGTRTGAGMAERQVTVSAEVVEVDTDDNTVEFKGPQGKTRKVKVSDPDLQAQLPNLSRGDVVELVYTEAVAASITPSGNKKTK